MARYLDYEIIHSPRCREPDYTIRLSVPDDLLINPFNISSNIRVKEIESYDPNIFKNDCRDIFMFSHHKINDIMNTM